MALQSDTVQGSGKTLLFPKHLAAVGIHCGFTSFSSHKIALAQVFHVCVPVAVVKTMPCLENIRSNKLSFLDGKKPFLKNASTCCTGHNLVASEAFFIAVGFCETLILMPRDFNWGK